MTATETIPAVHEPANGRRHAADRLAQALGWFSLALGVAELVAPGRITRAIGLKGKEGLVRAFGVREIAAGVPTLGAAKQLGLASRIAGDALDLATLAPALGRDNPRRGNALIAVAAVAGVAALDIAATIMIRRNRRDVHDAAVRLAAA